MAKVYILKESEKGLVYNDATMLDNPGSIELVNNEIRVKILKLLSKEPLYPAEIAKKLKMHEQKVYYHIKQLNNAGILDIVEKKEIRGTVAKKFRPKNLNFVVALEKNWKNAGELFGKKIDSELRDFLSDFVSDGRFSGYFVVGSPDPHGPQKARARDGHYTIDLALFFGKICAVPENFSVSLDVDLKSRGIEKENLVVVGGPVTNLISDSLNEHLPVKFSDTQPWELVSKKGRYNDESVGMIAKIPNPLDKSKSVLFLAGISSLGTKAAVIGLTRHYKEILVRYSGQKSFVSVVQGFDLDGDGHIDSVEILE